MAVHDTSHEDTPTSRVRASSHRLPVRTISRTEFFVARDARLLGPIVFADTVRPEAKRAIEALRGMGLRTVLLTGDTWAVANAVGSALGISEIEAKLLPEDKLARVRGLVAQRYIVAMVGDGVNDAPALAEANVGVAMGSGTDVAQESADVVLLDNDLARVVETLAIARRTRGIIWQNFVGSASTRLALCWPPSASSIRCSLPRFMSSRSFCSSSTRPGCCRRPRRPASWVKSNGRQSRRHQQSGIRRWNARFATSGITARSASAWMKPVTDRPLSFFRL